MKTIDQIREAMNKMHQRAMGDERAVYMSIPANPDRDADLILDAAITELDVLRRTTLDEPNAKIALTADGWLSPEKAAELRTELASTQAMSSAYMRERDLLRRELSVVRNLATQLIGALS